MRRFMRKLQGLHSSLLLIIFLLLGCSTLKQLAKIQKPNVGVTSVRITDFSFKTIDLLFNIQVDNPNDLSISFAGFDYDFHLNESPFMNGQQEKNITIDALASTDVEVPLTLAFENIYNTFQAVRDRDSVQYKMNLGLNFKLPVLGVTRVPLSHQGNVPLLKFPGIKVNNLKLTQMSLTGAKLALGIEIKNPNPIGFNVSNFKYGFQVGGKDWVSGNIQDVQAIQAKGNHTFTIPINLNFLSLGSTVYRLLAENNTIDYSLNGHINLNSSEILLKELHIPFDKTGEISLSR